MDLYTTKFFKYKNNSLYCEEIELNKLIKEYGTPIYVYSKNSIIENYNRFVKAFEGLNFRVFYAAKSNYNLNVIQILNKLGSGVDVNSQGEFFRAKKAGVADNDLIFTGVGKTLDEIKLAVSSNVLMIKAESLSEVIKINREAGNIGKIAPVALRINPEVDAQTHPHITTAVSGSKFGITFSEALVIYGNASKYPNINFCGIDIHIGSQITTPEPFITAVSVMKDFLLKVSQLGIKIEHFDIGGGFGIEYKPSDKSNFEEIAALLVPLLKSLDCEIIFEPGRFITANAGVLLSEIIYRKRSGDKEIIMLDAGTTELIRPAFYGSYHHIQPINIDESQPDIVVDIAGPICESSDYFAKERTIQSTIEEETLAIMCAGSYASVMSSNYNGRRRPPEIIIDKNKVYVTRSRETFEHLLFDEKIIKEL